MFPAHIDEMGLGKTIQIIALIAHLRHHNTAGPYLIAGPLATISNWVKEFQKWLPSCPVVLYHGDKEYREGLRKQHLPLHSQKQLQFPVVITSFDLCIIDRNHLEKYQWQYIILDEGHRIKNRNCKLLKDLKTFQSVSRLLLTGTPIQNSLEELWSLLNFCSPMIFDDLDIFKSWFDFKNIGEETQVNDILEDEETNRVVTKLHDILRPFVLRRLKHDTIGNQLLSKKEIVIYCGMSRLQQEYYNWVLDNSIRDQLVSLGVKRANRISQLNPQMNLRKVCNHPFLFGNILQQEGDDDEDEEDDDFVEEEEEEESSAKGGKKRAAKQKKVTNTAASRKKVESSPRKTSSTASTRVISKALDMNPAKLFTHASGKFKLLHRMLPRLRKDGHKVILFSQMTTLLDLIEDYLIDNDLPFVRFDGTTKLQERQDAIDEFNDVNSDVFIFLLSTRSGGLGINLTAADTAIIFDSDWNPHMDSQAQVCYVFSLLS